MRKATALTNDEQSKPPDHPQTTDPTNTTADSGAEHASAGTVGDADAGDRSATPPSRHKRLKLGAGAAVTSMCLALALSGSSTITRSSAAPLVLQPGTAPSAVHDEIDPVDRAIAAARANRSAGRTSLAFEPEDAEPEIVGRRYTTVDLNVRTKPDNDAKVVAVLDFGDKVKITDVKEDGWRQVVYKDKTRWVKSQYLSKDKPKPKPKGPSSAACPSSSGGSGMENGLSRNAVKVHRAVCAEFPSVSTYGGIRGSSGNHGTGHAVDIMVSGATGEEIAAYVRSHAAQLGVTEVIYQQRIWTTQRASEGWRHMSDRGSRTANHYDHVHVSVG